MSNETASDFYHLHLGGGLADEASPGVFEFNTECAETRIVGVLHSRREGALPARLLRLCFGGRVFEPAQPLELPATDLVEDLDLPILGLGQSGVIECDGPPPLAPALLASYEGGRRSVLGVRPHRRQLDSLPLPPGGNGMCLVGRASLPFELTGVEIDGDFPDGVLKVLDVKVGNCSCLMSSDELPAEIFRKPIPFGVFGGTRVGAGVDVTVEIRNVGKVGMRSVSAVAFGPRV